MAQKQNPLALYKRKEPLRIAHLKAQDCGKLWRFELDLPCSRRYSFFQASPTRRRLSAWLDHCQDWALHLARDKSNDGMTPRELGWLQTQELLPNELAIALCRHRSEVDVLEVGGELQTLPWELFWLPDPDKGPLAGEHLGLMFALVREPTDFTLPSLLPLNRLAALPFQPAGQTDRLEELEEIAKFCQAKSCAFEELSGDSRMLANIHADAIWVAGHSELLSASGGGQPLAPDMRLEYWAHTAAWSQDRRPFLILNTCYSSAAHHGPFREQGWIEAQFRFGAGALLGSWGPVTPAYATLFAKDLLRALLSGTPVALAVLQARRAIRHTSNPSALLYVLYAHPALALTYFPA